MARQIESVHSGSCRCVPLGHTKTAKGNGPAFDPFGVRHFKLALAAVLTLAHRPFRPATADSGPNLTIGQFRISRLDRALALADGLGLAVVGGRFHGFQCFRRYSHGQGHAAAIVGIGTKKVAKRPHPHFLPGLA